MYFGKKGYTVSTSAEHLIVKTWKDLNEMTVSAIETPKDIEGIQKILQYCREHNIKVKPIGAGHSFTSAAVVDDGGILISLENFNKIISITNDTITLEAGCTLAQMTQALKDKGLMLPACPEYGPFYVGAIAGTQFQESTGHMNDHATISSHVIGCKVIKMDGTVTNINSDLNYWRNNQGLGGIVVEVTYRVKPLQKSIVEFDIIKWDDYWKNRSELAKAYNEFFSIYMPILDSVFIEKRTYIADFEPSKYLELNKKYSAFMRRAVMINSMPWFYSGIQTLPFNLKQNLLSFGLNYIFRYFFINRKFLSTGGDRGFAFKSRPVEIYNDFMFDADVYPHVINEMREFLRDEKIAGAVLMATYAVAKDNNCIMSRTFERDAFCIDPVLYAPKNSELHMLMQEKIIDLGKRYHGRPHLNKVTNLCVDSVKYGYKKENLKDYLNWCNKQDPQGLLQGKFYRLLEQASK